MTRDVKIQVKPNGAVELCLPEGHKLNYDYLCHTRTFGTYYHHDGQILVTEFYNGGWRYIGPRLQRGTCANANLPLLHIGEHEKLLNVIRREFYLSEYEVGSTEGNLNVLRRVRKKLKTTFTERYFNEKAKFDADEMWVIANEVEQLDKVIESMEKEEVNK